MAGDSNRWISLQMTCFATLESWWLHSDWSNLIRWLSHSERELGKSSITDQLLLMCLLMSLKEFRKQKERRKERFIDLSAGEMQFACISWAHNENRPKIVIHRFDLNGCYSMLTCKQVNDYGITNETLNEILSNLIRLKNINSTTDFNQIIELNLEISCRA